MANEFIRQFTFLASILAGFGFAITIELMNISPRKKYTDTALGAMIISASLAFVCVVIGSLLLILLSGSIRGPAAFMVTRLALLVVLLFVVAMLAFMIGLIYSARSHSRRVGRLAAATMLISLILVIVFGFAPFSSL